MWEYLWRWLKKWLAEHRWAIAWTSIVISAIWIIGPVAWVVRKNHGTMAMLVNIWFLAKASLDYQHLFSVALIPIAMDLGLIMAWWICPKIAARRDQGVQTLKWEMNRWEGRLRDREWQLDREKVQFESQCQAKLHQANETIKTWEREARTRIAAREEAVERQRQLLEEEFAEQRQAENERQEKLEKREEEVGAREKECEFRLARLNKRQTELEVMRSELRHWEQNLHGWEQDLDERERGLREKETMEIPGEAAAPGSQARETGRDDDNQAAQVKSLEEKIWKLLSAWGEMKKRDLERKINKSRYERYWETAISNLLASGKIIYDADSNTYRCQHELIQ